MLKNQDRVIIPDCAFEDTFGMIRIRDTDNFQAGYMHQITFWALPMLRSAICGTNRSAHHHRNAQLPTRHITHFSRLVHQFIHALEKEVGILHIRYRTHTHQSSSNSSTCDSLFTDGCVDDPIRAKFSIQAKIDSECSTKAAFYSD